jgi:hypothetical protein
MRIRNTRAPLAASLVLAALAVGGCASMSEDECRTVDWRTIGYEDGVAGYSGDRIAQHRKACAEHGVTPDLALYQAGRGEGLREYCQPANGFRIGAHGGGYAGVCPVEVDAAFVNAYESGRQLYALEARWSNAASQLDSKRRELNRVEDEIVRKSAAVIRTDSTAEERAQALLDAKQLAEKSGRLKAEIRQLEKDTVRFEQELENYRSTVAYTG